ncbi:hypothetical protein HAX54_011560, partial [Datura stramonium]|nr:hypothetical protein [Datura stramonium]
VLVEVILVIDLVARCFPMIDGVTSFLREVIEAMTYNKKNTDSNVRKSPYSTKSKNKRLDKRKDTLVLANAEESLCFCVEGKKPCSIKYWDGRSFMLEKSFNLVGLEMHSKISIGSSPQGIGYISWMRPEATILT